MLFFYWKKFRQDKLTNQPSIEEYIEENSTLLDLDPSFNKKYFVELANLKSDNILSNNFAKSQYNYRKTIIIPESFDNSIFGWLSFIRNIDDTKLFNLLNAEGFMYLYFLKTTYFLLFIMSFMSILLVVPIIVYNDSNISLRSHSNEVNGLQIKNSTSNNTVYELDFLQSLTVKNIYNNDAKIYVILVISYIITFMAYYHVYNYKKKLELLTQYHENDNLDNDVSLHTIHLREINKYLTYKETLKLLSDFFQIHFFNEVLSIQVIPNYDKIVKIINTMFSLESELNKVERDNYYNFIKQKKEINGVVVDYEVFLKQKIKISQNILDYYRQLLARENTGNAFVCFKNPQIVQQILKNTNKYITSYGHTFHGTLLNMKNWRIKRAAAPSDIIWDNIKYSKRNRLIKMFLFTAVFFYICLDVFTPKVVS